MIIDTRFHGPRRKRQAVRGTSSISMSLLPVSAGGAEDDRIKLRLRIDNPNEKALEDELVLSIAMTRAEARQLGRQLVEYGSRRLEGEA